MKRKITLVMIVALMVIAFCTPVQAKTDTQIVRKFCRNTYGTSYKIKFIEARESNMHFLLNRAGRKIIYVETYKVRATGGRDARIVSGDYKGCYVALTKKTKPGKITRFYSIWNPNNNYEDDIVAVVNQGKIRR